MSVVLSTCPCCGEYQEREPREQELICTTCWWTWDAEDGTLRTYDPDAARLAMAESKTDPIVRTRMP